jgi:hypothetical protein
MLLTSSNEIFCLFSTECLILFGKRRFSFSKSCLIGLMSLF